MLIRQGLNFAVHFAGGILVGALTVAAVCALRRDDREDPMASAAPEPATAHSPEPPAASEPPAAPEPIG